jgi:hypothetical protein
MSRFSLGEPEGSLGRMGEGSERVALPGNTLLVGLQLGKNDVHGPRWLVMSYRPVVGEGRLELSQQENLLPRITAPDHSGGSGEVHVPEGHVISSLQLGGVSLSVGYRKIESPATFHLGPEEPGPQTKEPSHDGGGGKATKAGYTITGFELQRDNPDRVVSLKIWYRPVL